MTKAEANRRLRELEKQEPGEDFCICPGWKRWEMIEFQPPDKADDWQEPPVENCPECGKRREKKFVLVQFTEGPINNQPGDPSLLDETLGP